MQYLRCDPCRSDEEGEDHPPWQPAAARRQPGAARRRIVDDRHDLEGPARLRFRSRRRSGAAGRWRQPGLQPRPLRGGAQPDRRGVDARGAVPVGGHALPAPRRQPVGGTPAEAAPPPRVHPWAAPLQKPPPRVWIPGVISPETIVWAAQHGYPYIALNTPVDRTKRIWEIYDNVAAEAGFTPGPDYHGLLKQIHVAETEEKALKNAAQFRWMQGEFTGLAHPVWSTPSGYGSPENRRPFVEFAIGRAR